MTHRTFTIISVRLYYILPVLFLIMPGDLYALDNKRKQEIINKVVTYIEHHDPIEKFDKTNRPLRIQKTLVFDIDGDQQYEILVAIKPYFHQTPPIFIYRLLADGTVVRLNEALAPGHLEIFDDSYYNVHKTGKAADMAIRGTLPGERLLLIANYLRMRSHVIEYHSFSHIEQAGDGGYYVDLRVQSDRFKQLKDRCSDIQFSKINDLTYGKVSQGGPELLLVVTGNDLNVYQLLGLDRMGLLLKKSMIMPLPEAFISFSSNDTGLIGFRSLENHYNPLSIRLQLLQ